MILAHHPSSGEHVVCLVVLILGIVLTALGVLSLIASYVPPRRGVPDVWGLLAPLTLGVALLVTWLVVCD